MHDRPFSKELRYLLAGFAPMLAAATLMAWLNFHYSADRGLWPLIFAIQLFLNSLYAAASTYLAHYTGYRSIGLAWRHHTLLGMALAMHTFLYFKLQIDWSAANAWESLNLVQRVVYNAWTPWNIYLLSFGILAWLSFRRRKPH